MLQINLLREKPEFVIERLAIKNFKASELVHAIVDLDQKKRVLQKNLDDNLAESNKLATEIGNFFKQGNKAEADTLKLRTATLKEASKELSEQLEDASAKLAELSVQLPNLPHDSVPKGTHAEHNEIVSQEGEIPVLHKEAVPHWDLAKKFNLIDFDLGSKISGAGFPVYRGKGARLQRALINFFLESGINAGYEEIQPPYVVNEDSAYGTGQLPDKEGQMYLATLDKLYLIPTAEVPVTNIYRDVILKPADFPVKNVAYSACFRREAGSYGKDVRGLNRLHQFDKVEIVQIARAENSYEILDEMVAHVTFLLRSLGLPFRILRLCGGDMSFASALTYDFEVYSTAQERWLEVSSVSNFESFQANRLKLRIKNESGKTELAHTLNGSALALPRIMAALLENYQVEDGIRIPAVLVPYTGFEKIS
ncbi:MAG: serine--tRNA ligase [Bacteroidota bacterium]